MTHAEFARQAAYIAGNAAKWSGNCLVLPEMYDEHMSDEAVQRFCDMVRDRADAIQRAHAETSPTKEGQSDG